MSFNLKKTLFFSLLLLCSLSLFLLLCFPLSHHHHHHHHHIHHFHPTPPPPPKLAYFIHSPNNDNSPSRIFRLLLAIYHPRNYYLLHIDDDKEKEKVARMVADMAVFVDAQNVLIVEKSESVSEEGSSYLGMVLHGGSILLRWKKDWDWFINLNSSDYPLIPQDDLLHILSFLPRDLNFINHDEPNSTSQEIGDIIVDPRLYLQSGGKMFKGNIRRSTPRSFKFLTGSQHVILSHKFVEYVIIGWENFPRKLLLYLSNTRHSHNVYFQTIAYNSKRFLDTIINSNLRSNDCDAFCMKIPHSLRPRDFKKMLEAGGVFAGDIDVNDRVLDKIDSEILDRGKGRVAPGGWCLGTSAWFRYDSCWQWSDDDHVLRPGPAAKRFEKLMLSLLEERSFRSS